jgi:hypothetical protein
VNGERAAGLPPALIWDGNDAGRRLIPLMLVPVVLAIAALAAYRNRRTLGLATARLSRFVRRRQPRLSLIMSLLFIGLSIPVLIFILIYNYKRIRTASYRS